MFKHLIALVLVALAIVFVSPAVAHLQAGALYRLDLWVPAADGLPFRSKRSPTA
jgi:hypothetical protein